jgi:hypothetical protein
VIDEGKPIRIFYANLLHAGLTFRVYDGQLKIGGKRELLSPVVREEIKRRAEHLIELLSPEIPEALEPYFYKLIKVDELKEAIGVAEQMGMSLRTTPVNGGWLIEILNRHVGKIEKKGRKPARVQP